MIQSLWWRDVSLGTFAEHLATGNSAPTHEGSKHQLTLRHCVCSHVLFKWFQIYVTADSEVDSGLEAS